MRRDDSNRSGPMPASHPDTVVEPRLPEGLRVVWVDGGTCPAGVTRDYSFSEIGRTVLVWEV